MLYCLLIKNCVGSATLKVDYLCKNTFYQGENKVFYFSVAHILDITNWAVLLEALNSFYHFLSRYVICLLVQNPTNKSVSKLQIPLLSKVRIHIITYNKKL